MILSQKRMTTTLADVPVHNAMTWGAGLIWACGMNRSSENSIYMERAAGRLCSISAAAAAASQNRIFCGVQPGGFYPPNNVRLAPELQSHTGSALFLLLTTTHGLFAHHPGLASWLR